MNKNIDKVVVILGIISVLLIIGISFFTWRYCDDFVYEKSLQTRGVFEHMYYIYSNWEGRAISIGGFIQIFLFKYFNHKIIVFVWSLFFIANAYLILKIFLSELSNKIRISRELVLFFIGIVVVTLFYGFYTHIAETVYWAMGGVYTCAVFFGLLWIILYKKMIAKVPKIVTIGSYFIFSIIVGMITQNLTICLLTFLLIEGIFLFYHNEKRKILYLILIAIGLLIGLSITSFSPGTLHRIAVTPHSFGANPLYYLKNLYTSLKVFLITSVVLSAAAVISAVVIFTYFKQKISIPLNQEKNRLINFLYTTKWLIIALSSVLPFIFVPTNVSRTAIFFMVFVYIFFLLFVVNILSKIKSLNILKWKKICNLYLLFFFSGHIVYMAYSFKIGYEYNSYMNAINDYLITKKNATETIIVKNKHLPYRPFMYNTEFMLTKDPKNWINEEWSTYYDIKSLRTE